MHTAILAPKNSKQKAQTLKLGEAWTNGTFWVRSPKAQWKNSSLMLGGGVTSRESVKPVKKDIWCKLLMARTSEYGTLRSISGEQPTRAANSLSVRQSSAQTSARIRGSTCCG